MVVSLHRTASPSVLIAWPVYGHTGLGEAMNRTFHKADQLSVSLLEPLLKSYTCISGQIESIPIFTLSTHYLSEGFHILTVTKKAHRHEICSSVHER